MVLNRCQFKKENELETMLFDNVLYKTATNANEIGHKEVKSFDARRFVVALIILFLRGVNET